MSLQNHETVSLWKFNIINQTERMSLQEQMASKEPPFSNICLSQPSVVDVF